MRKNIILLISAIVLFSCNQTKTDNTENAADITTEKKTDTNEQTVKLSLESTELQLSELPYAIKVIMTNHTNDTITTGDYFRIEKLENNEWIEFTPKNIAFHDIGYDLGPNNTKTFEEVLFKNQVDYKLGKYRIAKEYLKSDYQQNKEKFIIYVEFEVN